MNSDRMNRRGRGVATVAANEAGAGRPRGSSGSRVWWRRPWIVPLMVVCAAFLVFSLPPYLSLDSAQSRAGLRAGVGFHYPVLLLHILFGTIALITSCFQVWPHFRAAYPAAHRVMGRIYVFGGVLPGGVAGVVVSALHTQGLAAQLGNAALSLSWLAAGILGYRAARERRFRDHRVWMIRGFALTTSIVANRLWVMVCLGLAMPQLNSTYHGDELAMEQSMAAAAVWLSWVVNLLIAEWWLQYRGRRRPAVSEGAGR
ncbi:DUF2306 domain-containing protein [Nocardia sp. BMG51109]|uniref:DUF2306 domain-containing protein n=1 Tax=Nocardia sp. BMG51109 TaxID=1056816 RepID=UPI0004674C61|nr:DUF2306 domain-containing protein [Nocardia sp. BMG51109]